jgi:hypothetical protein
LKVRILLLLVVVSTVTGCVDRGRVPSPTLTQPTTTTLPPTTAPPTPVDVAITEFERCLSEHGLDSGPIPIDALGRPRLDWFLGGLALTDSETVSALTACASHLGTGALDLSGEPEIKEGVLEALGDFSVCMRSRGVPEFPDPVPGFNGLGAPYPMAEIPYSDPDLDEAVAACRERIPVP